MTKVNLLFVLMMVLGSVVSCNAQTAEKSGAVITSAEKTVRVYYFHYTRRCATCLAVEEQSRLAVESLYSEQVANGKISFEGINMDEESGAKLAAENDVNGQSLLIVSGKEKTDLIREGFLYARSNPEKLKQLIKETIDPLLL